MVPESIKWLQSSQLVYHIQQWFSLQRSKVDDKIIIGNYFWYYIFLFGTILGDELFYSIFIPFWFWNIDSIVGRRMIFIWAITMYIGQTLKDVIQMPRPDFPAIKLKDRWCMEYGMPSTHAMVSVTLPLSIFYFSSEYNIPISILIITIWSSVICLSRIYLGMHTVLDIIIGLILAKILTIILFPITDIIDFYLLNNYLSPLLLILITVGIIICYPHSGKWTPTRSDTTIILAVFNGIYIGGWIGTKLNICVMQTFESNLIRIICKTTIGLAGMLLLKSYLKTKIFQTLCQLSGHDQLKIQQAANSLDNTVKIRIELTCIYITYTCLGLYVQFGNCFPF